MIEPKILLKQVFPAMNEDTLTEMIRYARMKTYAPQTLLCIEGAEENVFYIIGEGSVEITKRFEEGGEEHRLRRSGPGDFFGEMALIANSPRNANVRTLERTTVLEIDKPLFIEMLRYSPAVALTMFRIAVDRMRANDQRAMHELGEQKQEIERAYAQLQKQEAQRTEFLTTMAHELRTPLTVASGYMQLIGGGQIDGAALEPAHQRVGTALEQVISLVNDLMFVQEMDMIEPSLRAVSLQAVTKQAVELLREKADANAVNLQNELAETLPTVRAEPDGLTRALTALIDNAIKFTPNGGDVMLRAYTDREFIHLTIQDTGIGIAPDLLPHIFERFRRIDRYQGYVFSGVGLGLSIAKHLIESFGGTISVTTELEKGSSFTLHLPIQ